MSPLPVGLRVLWLLQARVPAARWDSALVIQTVADFADVDAVEVAGRCAAYMQETPSARNGQRTLRTFLERERADQRRRSREAREAERLSIYDRPRNRS